MTETVRRPWWRRKRWWAATAAWLVFAYPLSAGPALWLARRGHLPRPLGAVYLPIEVVCFPAPKPGFEWLRDYAEWCASD